MTAGDRPAVARAIDEIEAVRRFWYPLPAPARLELEALDPDLLVQLAIDHGVLVHTKWCYDEMCNGQHETLYRWVHTRSDCTCRKPGVAENPECPRHGIVAFINRAADARQADVVDDEVLCEHGHVARLCVLCPRDERLAVIDEEVDRRSDAAADRADAMVDRYDPDDREPMGGDPWWAEETDR